MTTRIILVRHGQTEWNVAEVFRGRIDIELDETGLRQADLLAEYLSHRKLEAVYSSPLQRALQTAEAIARHYGLTVEIVPGLNDVDFGEWQGLAHGDVRTRYSEVYRDWTTNPRCTKFPSGESLEEVRQRALAVVDKVTKQPGTVVLASHRVVHKLLICALLGLDDSHFWNIRIDTCGMTTFDFTDGQFVLTEHNNTSFLEPLKHERLSDF